MQTSTAGRRPATDAHRRAGRLAVSLGLAVPLVVGLAPQPASANPLGRWETRVVGSSGAGQIGAAQSVNQFQPGATPDPGGTFTWKVGSSVTVTGAKSAEGAISYATGSTASGGGNLAPLGVGIDAKLEGSVSGGFSGKVTYTKTNATTVNAEITGSITLPAQQRNHTGHLLEVYPIGTKYQIQQRWCWNVINTCQDWTDAGSMVVPTGVGFKNTFLGWTTTTYGASGLATITASKNPKEVGTKYGYNVVLDLRTDKYSVWFSYAPIASGHMTVRGGRTNSLGDLVSFTAVLDSGEARGSIQVVRDAPEPNNSTRGHTMKGSVNYPGQNTAVTFTDLRGAA
jgi:hypothetical protein